jgi:hypothetical protein
MRQTGGDPDDVDLLDRRLVDGGAAERHGLSHGRLSGCGQELGSFSTSIAVFRVISI